MRASAWSGIVAGALLVGSAVAAASGVLRRRPAPAEPDTPDVIDQEHTWLTEAVDLGAQIEREKWLRGETGGPPVPSH